MGFFNYLKIAYEKKKKGYAGDISTWGGVQIPASTAAKGKFFLLEYEANVKKGR